MNQRLQVLILLLVVLLGNPLLGQGNRLPVVVSILPQAQFLERLGGNRIQVDVLIGPGHSHHSYEPSPKQIAGLARAKALFCIGVPVEKSILTKLRKSHPGLRVVETQKGVPLIKMDAACDEPGHVHHSAENLDPHIWMSPRLVKIQARNICEALVELDPPGKLQYEGHLKSFLQELDRLDERISHKLAKLKGRKFYVFHPAFGYFAEAYGLIQVPIEMEGKEPGAKQLGRLVERAKKDGVRMLFVQPQFSQKSAQTMAKSLGGVVIPLDPLAKDYVANLERVASAVEEGLR